KPLIDGGLLDLTQWPVINATSGVSGAGRKAAISNSFCEVSLQHVGDLRMGYSRFQAAGNGFQNPAREISQMRGEDDLRAQMD
ncbi:hypothetical protein MJO10_33855, partial [Salmonella enterica subsp. enterica serovar Anatum]|nr:hypothetical protein [Salmonella enterica subsp. enterica serovar Anatum]